MNFADGNNYIDIIVYIIIMVVGLIASAYRNYSKKRGIESQPHDDGVPGFPEIEFEPVFDEPVLDEPVIVDTLSPIPETVRETEPVSDLDTTESIEEVVSLDSATLSDAPEKEGQAVFFDTSSRIFSANFDELEHSQIESQQFQKSIANDEIGSMVEEEVETEFDLKDAVIYSEILLNKYISKSY
jgi:hypothetical protein